MTRVWVYVGLLTVAVAQMGALGLMVSENSKLRNNLRDCNAVISNTEKFNEGASNPDGLNWFDRLYKGSPN